MKIHQNSPPFPIKTAISIKELMLRAVLPDLVDRSIEVAAQSAKTQTGQMASTY
jgi:hypothetical protein